MANEDMPCFIHGKLPELSSIYCRPEEQYKALLHAHSEHLEIIYVLRGEGEEIIGDRLCHVGPGDLMVINCGTLHGENPLSVSSFMTYSFLFKNVHLKNRLLNCLLPIQGSPVISSGCGKKELQDLVISAYRLLSDPKMRSTCRMLSISLLTFIYEESLRNLPFEDATSRRGNLLVAKIQQYMGRHYSEDLTLSNIADNFHISRYYLTHIFTKYIGCPPIHYLTERRIGEAQMRLQNTDTAIADISEAVGFTSPSYFNHIFKTYTKMTPGRYRELSTKPGEQIKPAEI